MEGRTSCKVLCVHWGLPKPGPRRGTPTAHEGSVRTARAAQHAETSCSHSDTIDNFLGHYLKAKAQHNAEGMDYSLRVHVCGHQITCSCTPVHTCTEPRLCMEMHTCPGPALKHRLRGRGAAGTQEPVGTRSRVNRTTDLCMCACTKHGRQFTNVSGVAVVTSVHFDLR